MKIFDLISKYYKEWDGFTDWCFRNNREAIGTILVVSPVAVILILAFLLPGLTLSLVILALLVAFGFLIKFIVQTLMNSKDVYKEFKEDQDAG